MTTMNALDVGRGGLDRGDRRAFRTRAAGAQRPHMGADRIRKVGLEFLDRRGAGHLVPSDERARRARHPGARRAARPEPRVCRAGTRPCRSRPSPRHAGAPGAPALPAAPVTRDEVVAVLERPGARSHFEVLGHLADRERRGGEGGGRADEPGGSIRTSARAATPRPEAARSRPSSSASPRRTTCCAIRARRDAPRVGCSAQPRLAASPARPPRSRRPARGRPACLRLPSPTAIRCSPRVDVKEARLAARAGAQLGRVQKLEGALALAPAARR